MPKSVRTFSPVNELPMHAMVMPNAAVSRPFTSAPLLTTATAAMPASDSRKNSAEPSSLSTSRPTGRNA